MEERERVGSAGRRVELVHGALARYRSARRRDGGGLECLVDRAAVAEPEARRQRRRVELVARAAAEQGLARRFAEQVYDVAWEEGVEPAFAFELVRCGVAVCEAGEPGVAGGARVSVGGVPSWPVEESPEAAARERRLRLSFRRLRTLFERHGAAERALAAFAREPDVGECGY